MNQVVNDSGILVLLILKYIVKSLSVHAIQPLHHASLGCTVQYTAHTVYSNIQPGVEHMQQKYVTSKTSNRERGFNLERRLLGPKVIQTILVSWVHPHVCVRPVSHTLIYCISPNTMHSFSSKHVTKKMAVIFTHIKGFGYLTKATNENVIY